MKARRGLIAVLLITPFLSIPAQAAVVNYNCGTSGTYQVENTTKTLTGNTNCVGTLNISSNVEIIGNYAFSGRTTLTAVTIPSSVKTIGTGAFSSAHMNSLTLNEGLLTIGNTAFSNVSTNGNTVSITLPNSLTTINTAAFSNSTFSSYSVGPNVTSMLDGVFYNNANTGPTSVTFRGTSSLTSISATLFTGYRGTELILPSGVTTISIRSFEFASNLTNILIPSGVTSIGNQSFQYMASLNLLVFPSGLSTLGTNAFTSTTGLQTVLYCGASSAILNYAYPNGIQPTCASAAIFSANGGTGTMTPQISSTSQPLSLNTFTRSGYVFAGWNTKADGSGTNYSNGGIFPFSESSRLFAKWALPDLTAPTITSSKTISLAENLTFATNVVANEVVTISIFDGADQSKFSLTQIEDSASALSFIAPPNFEAPTDTGSDNTYVVVLKAQDLSNNFRVDTFTITVTNIADPIQILSKTVPATAVKGVVSTITISVDAPSLGTFKAQGRNITKCIRVSSAGSGPYTLTCAWKPATQTGINLSLALVPIGGTSTTASYSLGSVGVGKRSTKR